MCVDGSTTNIHAYGWELYNMHVTQEFSAYKTGIHYS